MIRANKNVDLRIALKIGVHEHIYGMVYGLGACPAWRVTECGRLSEEEIGIVEGN